MKIEARLARTGQLFSIAAVGFPSLVTILHSAFCVLQIPDSQEKVGHCDDFHVLIPANSEQIIVSAYDIQATGINGACNELIVIGISANMNGALGLNQLARCDDMGQGYGHVLLGIFILQSLKRFLILVHDLS